MAERTAAVRIVATGDRSVRNALNGVTRAVSASAREQTRISRDQAQREKAAARERLQIERSGARERDKLAREDLRRVDRVERERVAAARRAAREELRIAEQSSRSRSRMEQREARERQARDRQRDRNRRGLLQGATAAGAAVVAGATSAYARAQSVAGVDSQEGRLRAAGEFGLGLIQYGGNSGLTREQRDQLGDRIVATSDRTGIRSGELLAGLNEAQSRFGGEAAADLAGMLDQLADASVATGSTVADLIGTLGTARSAYQLSGEQLEEFLGIMVQASRDGAIDARDFAGNFASSLAQYSQRSGRTGIEGAREAVGLAQVIGSGQFGAAESATRFDALVRQLGDPAVQRRFRDAGAPVAEGGRMLPLDEVIANIQGSQRLGTSRGLASLQLDSQAEEALLVIRREGSEGYSRFANVDAAAGRQFVRDTSQEMFASPYARVTRIGAQAENAMIRNADGVLNTIVGPLEAVQGLENEFPLLTAALGTLTDVLKTVGAALVVNSAVGGALGGGAAAAGAGAAGGAGTGLLAAAGGGLATLSTIALGGAALALPLIAATAGTASDTGVRSDNEGNALQRASERNRVLAGDLSPEARAAFLGGLREQDAGGRQRAIAALGQQQGLGSLTPDQAAQLARTGQVIELGPATIAALRADAMPEGTAGEGSASRGRRSGESPQARR